MKQIFVVEVNVPYDQYGLESDDLLETLQLSHNPDDQYGLESDDLLETLQLSHNPEVKFRVAEISDRVNITRIESMLRD